MPAHDDSEVPKQGDVIAEKYAVEHVLGVGGMGVVVAARHLDLEQPVAIKFMRDSALGNAAAVARFLREARALVSLSSEHVAKVLDVGKLASGAPYMVMEYLEGKDLAGYLRDGGVMEASQAVDLILQACAAIAEAHARGIVHRDLKPANLFVTQRLEGTALLKVLDFGISKSTALQAGAAALTATGSLMGSPAYMSPEQIRSTKTVDPRTDIWSLGVILYEMLAGRTPFAGETLGETFARILSDAVPPLDVVRPDVPPGLATVIERCLARDLDARVQTVGELATLLLPFAPAEASVLVGRIVRLSAGAQAPSASPSSPPVPAREKTITSSGFVPRAGFSVPPLGEGQVARPPAPVLGSTTAQAVSSTTDGATPETFAPALPATAGGYGKVRLLAGLAAAAVVLALAGTWALRAGAPGEAPAQAGSLVETAPLPKGPTSVAAPLAPVASAASIDPPSVASTSAPTASAAAAGPTAVASAAVNDGAGKNDKERTDAARGAPRAAPSATPHRHVAGPAPALASAMAASAVAAPSPAPSPECHLVSYYDGNGDKHFKQECQ